jgi:hypothetical protein
MSISSHNHEQQCPVRFDVAAASSGFVGRAARRVGFHQVNGKRGTGHGRGTGGESGSEPATHEHEVGAA